MAGKSGVITITGDDPREALPPTFANFVKVSHLGGEVQLEFVFLDLDELGKRIREESSPDFAMQGKTVAKLVIPVPSFMQLKDHLGGMFAKFEGMYEQSSKKEAPEREYGN